MGDFVYSYKNYISLGFFCAIAEQLEDFGLRSFSSPFDWLISDLKSIISLIDNGFESFLNEKYLAQNQKERHHYKNVLYNIEFYHDFSSLKSFPFWQTLFGCKVIKFSRHGNK